MLIEGDVCAWSAAQRATIYTIPGAFMPFIEPLMRFFARRFPDEGLKTVRLCLTRVVEMHSYDTDHMAPI